MMKKDDIKKLALLSRIEVEDEELSDFAHDIESILDYVSLIKDAVGEEPVPAAGVLRNVMREDGEPHTKGAYTESLLQAAPQREGNYFKVKKILSQE